MAVTPRTSRREAAPSTDFRSRPWAPRHGLLSAAIVFALVILLRLPHALHTYQPDDAYITYRYAANLAAGQGFVYNAGDHTLGTTSPLLALLLAVPAALHLDLPTAAGALSMFAAALCCAVVFELLWFATGNVFGGLAAALLLAVSPLQLHIATSGMEPALLCLLLAGSLSLLLHGETRWAALCAGLAAITRPEGLFWLPLVCLLLRREGRWDWRALLTAALPPLLWGIFATAYFGSPLPQSMIAKVAQGRDIAQAPLQVVFGLLDRMGAGPLLGLLVLWGAVLAFKREPRLLICLAFGALFIASYAVTRPAVYTWYPAPLELCAVILIGFGVGAAVRTLCQLDKARVSALCEGPALALLALFVILSVPRVASWHPRPEPQSTVNGFLAAAQWVAAHTTPSDRILIGDVGYVGFYNLGIPVYDYYGLVWRTPPDALSQPLSPQMLGGVLDRMIEVCRPTMLVTEAGKAPLVPPAGFRRIATPTEIGRAVFVRTR